MLEMNEFEKIAKEIIEKKDRKLIEVLEFVYYLLAIITIFVCFFVFGSNLVKTVGMVFFVIMSLFLVGIPLYFLLKFIISRNNKEYKNAIVILENYEEQCKEEQIKKMQVQKKEYIEKINRIEEYAKNLKNNK